MMHYRRDGWKPGTSFQIMGLVIAIGALVNRTIQNWRGHDANLYDAVQYGLALAAALLLVVPRERLRSIGELIKRWRGGAK